MCVCARKKVFQLRSKNSWNIAAAAAAATAVESEASSRRRRRTISGPARKQARVSQSVTAVTQPRNDKKTSSAPRGKIRDEKESHTHTHTFHTRSNTCMRSPKVATKKKRKSDEKLG